MMGTQMGLDLAGRPSRCVILDRTHTENRH